MHNILIKFLQYCCIRKDFVGVSEIWGLTVWRIRYSLYFLFFLQERKNASRIDIRLCDSIPSCLCALSIALFSISQLINKKNKIPSQNKNKNKKRKNFQGFKFISFPQITLSKTISRILPKKNKKFPNCEPNPHSILFLQYFDSTIVFLNALHQQFVHPYVCRYFFLISMLHIYLFIFHFYFNFYVRNNPYI